MSNSTTEFNVRLIESIQEAGWKFYGAGRAIARVLDVSPRMGSKYLNGEAVPGREKIIKLSETLGVNPQWLEYGVGPKRPASHVHAQVPSSPIGTPSTSMAGTLPYLTEINSKKGFGSTEIKESNCNRPSLEQLILAKLNGGQKDAALVVVKGDSMAPVIPDGSVACIDKNDKTVTDGKLYALDHKGQLRIKKLMRLPGGGMRIGSFNPDYCTEDYSQADLESGEIKIIGRVFWYSVFA